MTRDSIKEFLRRSLRDLGLAHGLGEPLPPTPGLPDALNDWYEVAGDGPVSRAQNRIFPPSGLRTWGDKVVFAEENQGVVVWAYQASDTSEDPLVWQGQPVADGVEWYSEDERLSRFLIDMLAHTVSPD